MRRHILPPPPPIPTALVRVDPGKAIALMPRCSCTRKGKIAGRTEFEARALEAEIGKYNGGSEPVRFYQCGRGMWHWSRLYAEEATS